jgi:hypothetical protein
MTGKAWSRCGGRSFMRSIRRCRALTNLSLLLAAQLPATKREAVYRQILRTLLDHIGEPEGASAAIAELLADNTPQVA